MLVEIFDDLSVGVLAPLVVDQVEDNDADEHELVSVQHCVFVVQGEWDSGRQGNFRCFVTSLLLLF